MSGKLAARNLAASGPGGRSIERNEARERILELFAAAAELPAAARPQFLADHDLTPAERAEIESLLAAGDRTAPGFLDAPIAAEDALRLLDRSEGGIATNDGRRVGPYRLVAEIGRGGMGTVYLAERVDGGFEQQVALKLVKRGMDSDAIVRRFLHERQILARLDHPNIARLFDGGTTDDGQPYFAMEHVEGEPIDHYCAGRDLGVRARLELFVPVCRAVQTAHARLVVHRDLKPSNILIDVGGQPKLLDFGIAKVLSGSDDAELTVGTVASRPMTPAYAAPEQIRGEPVTVATDVFALGVVLYQLLAGSHPYSEPGRTPAEVARAVESSEPAPPSSAATTAALARQLRGDLDTIVLAALAHEPARRYPSVEALAADIETYLAGLPIRARPSSALYRARRFVGRHRVGVAAGLLTALAVLGGLASTAWQAREAARERDTARREAAKLEASQDYLVSLFRAAEPASALGEDVTARQLVARGIERIGGLAGQPAVQLDLYQVLARVAAELGDHDQAGRLLDDAVPLALRIYGDDSLETADLSVLQGRLLFETGRWAEAEALLGDALATYERLQAGDRRPALDALEFLAMAVRSQDRFAEAVAIEQRAMALSRRVFGPRSRETATHLNQLGLLLGLVGDDEGSEAALREALDVARQVHGDEHPEVAAMLVNLANTLMRQGNLAAAEPFYRDGVAMEVRLRGTDHPRYAVKLHNLANFLHSAGRYDEAADLHRTVVETLESRFGEAHPHTGAALDSLAADLAAAGRFDESWPLFERAERVLAATAGADSALYAIHRWRLARALVEDGRSGEALAPVAESIAILEAMGVSQERQLALALTVRGDVQSSLGRAAEAEADLRRALAIQRRVLGARHHGLGRTLCALAKVLLATGGIEEARSLAGEADEIVAASLPEGHPVREEARATLLAARNLAPGVGTS